MAKLVWQPLSLVSKAEEGNWGEKAPLEKIKTIEAKSGIQLDVVLKSPFDVLKTFEGYVFAWFINLLFLPTVTSLLIEIRCSRPA